MHQTAGARHRGRQGTRLLTRLAPGALQQAAAALLRHRPAGSVIAARGSSDHGATYPAGRLTELAARVVTLTDGAGGGRKADTVVRVRTELPVMLTPIPFAVAGQLLALRMAVRLGVDPARPHGLRKVTVTR